jgi:hypothetical protein
MDNKQWVIYDDEEFSEAMANFDEIVKAHNDKLEVVIK